MADKSSDAFRTISEVADWLGVQTHVLRFWESKFSQVKPVKRAGGRRYYRPDDMRLLGGIRKLLHDDGMTIKGVQKILREKGVDFVSDLSDRATDQDVQVAVTEPSSDIKAHARFEEEADTGATVLQPDQPDETPDLFPETFVHRPIADVQEQDAENAAEPTPEPPEVDALPVFMHASSDNTQDSEDASEEAVATQPDEPQNPEPEPLRPEILDLPPDLEPEAYAASPGLITLSAQMSELSDHQKTAILPLHKKLVELRDRTRSAAASV